jgi:hypothetical protein
MPPHLLQQLSEQLLLRNIFSDHKNALDIIIVVSASVMDFHLLPLSLLSELNEARSRMARGESTLM